MAMGSITGWEAFASDLAKSFGQEFCDDFASTLTDEVRAEEEVKHASAQGRQRRIAEATARLEHAWFDGLGELHFRVDPDVFFHWVQKEGREIWNDKNFIAEFKRDNPETIVRSRSRKTMVVRP